ncbi:hypothetical protein RRG08_020743 [Elysia crispata]|uniref:Uncharacterized protein n=1 Tax=Elysia crispata TaxID=231223 RepID=A0AAE1E3Y9_9GAST|nr:hypothetical protein RRG08_020743 [Elysia crispata]
MLGELWFLVWFNKKPESVIALLVRPVRLVVVQGGVSEKFMFDFEFAFNLLGGQEGYRRCVGERNGELAPGIGGPKVYLQDVLIGHVVMKVYLNNVPREVSGCPLLACSQEETWSGHLPHSRMLCDDDAS